MINQDVEFIEEEKEEGEELEKGMLAPLYRNPRLYIEYCGRRTLAEQFDQLKASPSKTLPEDLFWGVIESLLLAMKLDR